MKCGRLPGGIRITLYSTTTRTSESTRGGSRTFRSTEPWRRCEPFASPARERAELPGAWPLPPRSDPGPFAAQPDSVALWSLSTPFLEEERNVVGTVVHRPGIDEVSVDQLEVAPTRVEPPANHRLRHVVTAFRHPLSDSRDRRLRRREAQEEELHPVPLFPPSGDPARMTAPAQRRLESEAMPLPRVRIDLPQHQPAGLDGHPAWAKGAQPSRDQVGIDEDRTVGFVRQELRGERRLARTVRPKRCAITKIRLPVALVMMPLSLAPNLTNARTARTPSATAASTPSRPIKSTARSISNAPQPASRTAPDGPRNCRSSFLTSTVDPSH